MLKLLLKKQLTEVFKSYFYNPKKNKARSKGGIIAMFLFFGVVMVGVLGGMFTFLSVSLCEPMMQVGMTWLYFMLMSCIAIFLGAFGSVFNTFSGLYLGKDNDLLLSLPIPVKYIITSRLMNVFLLGTMYSAVAILPAVIVYWVTAGVTAARVVCGIVLMLVIFLIVLILSCLLGWCVAKISLKLKNKSFVTVLLSLLFIAAYYFVYYKASDLIQDLIRNAADYGAKIKGSAYALYLFGSVGEGNWGAAAAVLGITLALFGLTWIILKKTFLSIATSSSATAKKQYKEKRANVRSPFRALLGREFGKFTATPNYMLNCGLGVLLIPAMGVLLLLKGKALLPVLEAVFAEMPGVLSVIFCAVMMLIGSMNDMAAPAVSLEGKSLWIPQSLPVMPKTVLRAKTAMHLILTGIPMLFTLGCALYILPGTAAELALMSLITVLYILFSALFASFIGVSMPNLTWTNETVPIKQSGAVTIALFSGWVLVAIFAAVFFLFAYKLGATVYMGIWAGVLLFADIFLKYWLDTKGAARFATL